MCNAKILVAAIRCVNKGFRYLDPRDELKVVLACVALLTLPRELARKQG
jgi:hypothetical protein